MALQPGGLVNVTLGTAQAKDNVEIHRDWAPVKVRRMRGLDEQPTW